MLSVGKARTRHMEEERMDFTLSEKHKMAQQLFRDFSLAEVKPLAQEIDKEHRFPEETVAKMAKYGFS